MLWGVISVHVYSNVILSSKCGNAVAAQLLCLDCPEGLRMLWRAASRLLRTEDAGERESSYIPGRYLIYPWGSNFPKSHYQQPHYNGIRRGSRLICIQLVDLFFSYLIGWPLNPLLLQITKIGLILSSENKSGIFTFQYHEVVAPHQGLFLPGMSSLPLNLLWWKTTHKMADVTFSFILSP